MEINSKVTAQGYGSLLTYKLVNGQRVNERQIGEFKNLITNKGITNTTYYNNTYFDPFGWVYGFNDSIMIGSGTTLPKYTDTKLVSYLRNATTSVDTEISFTHTQAGYDRVLRRVGTFNPTGSVYSVSELGLGNSNNAYTRALVMAPVTGVATTLNIAADEYLEVTYFIHTSYSLAETLSVSFIGHPTQTTSLTINIQPSVTTTCGPNPKAITISKNQSIPNRPQQFVVSDKDRLSQVWDLPRTVEFGENGIATIVFTAVYAPSSEDRTFYQIVMGNFNIAYSYFQGCTLLMFPDGVVWPANYGLTVKFKAHIERDPEPTE